MHPSGFATTATFNHHHHHHPEHLLHPGGICPHCGFHRRRRHVGATVCHRPPGRWTLERRAALMLAGIAWGSAPDCRGQHYRAPNKMCTTSSARRRLSTSHDIAANGGSNPWACRLQPRHWHLHDACVWVAGCLYQQSRRGLASPIARQVRAYEVAFFSAHHPLGHTHHLCTGCPQMLA